MPKEVLPAGCFVFTERSWQFYGDDIDMTCRRTVGQYAVAASSFWTGTKLIVTAGFSRGSGSFHLRLPGYGLESVKALLEDFLEA